MALQNQALKLVNKIVKIVTNLYKLNNNHLDTNEDNILSKMMRNPDMFARAVAKGWNRDRLGGYCIENDVSVSNVRKKGDYYDINFHRFGTPSSMTLHKNDVISSGAVAQYIKMDFQDKTEEAEELYSKFMRFETAVELSGFVNDEYKQLLNKLCVVKRNKDDVYTIDINTFTETSKQLVDFIKSADTNELKTITYLPIQILLNNSRPYSIRNAFYHLLPKITQTDKDNVRQFVSELESKIYQYAPNLMSQINRSNHTKQAKETLEQIINMIYSTNPEEDLKTTGYIKNNFNGLHKVEVTDDLKIFAKMPIITNSLYQL